MSSLWRIELLGGLSARHRELRLTRFRTQKTAALLAYLAFHRERAHPREVLIELFWPEAEPDSGRHNLRVALSSLRTQFEPPGIEPGSVLIADRSRVQLYPQAVITDVAEFETALKAAEQAANRTQKREHLVRAFTLYCGSLLPGCFDSWILAQQLRLEDLYVQATLGLLILLEQGGEIQEAIRYGDQAITLDPACEELHLALMRLYARAGQTAMALAQYGRLEQILQEQFGEGPSPRAQRLAQGLRERADPLPEALPDASPSRAPVSLARSSGLPSGTLTFLLTDVEGAVAPVGNAEEILRPARDRHQSLLRQAFQHHNGYVVKEVENGFVAAFERADAALACAIAAQSALEAESCPEGVGAVKVCMALHTGDVTLAGGDYQGPTLTRALRMLATVHGGQIVCSHATAELLRQDVGSEVQLKDLGLYRLRDDSSVERLFQILYPGMAAEAFPPLRAAAATKSYLPLQLTRFFGRESELGRLLERLISGDTRLLTLTGPGGTGKTRLSLEFASRVRERFSGAVWFVPLAEVSDARSIPVAIEEALGLLRQPDRTPLEQVVERLSSQPSLLVLDNFEQVVEEGTAVVRQLLEQAPTLSCLVTSRQRLNSAGERELIVPPLPTPEGLDSPEQMMRVPSVQLFVDRAQSVRPDFQLTRANAQAVAELCKHLEGIPLALELPAARANVMSPAQMLGQLANRLDFFTSRQRETVARHKTLRAAIDWSYRLLTSELQHFFARLSVFRGGWTAEAAQAVCEEPQAIDYLSELREGSLIQAEERSDHLRFRFLEIIREYAEQLLPPEELAALAQQHRSYFLQIAEEAAPHLQGAQQADWLARLDAEHDNLRRALIWSVEKEARLRLAAALWPFWHIRGYFQEGRRWLEGSLDRAASAPGDVRARAYTGAGILASSQGDYEAARGYFDLCHALQRETGDRQGLATTLKNLGSLAQERNDFDQARAFLQEAVLLQEELGDKPGLARSLGALGNIAREQGQYGQARALYEQSGRLFQELDDAGGIAASRMSLGLVALAQGLYADAQTLFEQSLEIRRGLGNRQNIGRVLNNLGLVAAYQGDFDKARAFNAEALAIRRELGDLPGIALSLENLGEVALDQGDDEAAYPLLEESLALSLRLGDRQTVAYVLEGFVCLASVRLCKLFSKEEPARLTELARGAVRLSGAAETLRADLQIPIPQNEQARYARFLAPLRDQVGEQEFAQLLADGRVLPWEQAILAVHPHLRI